MIKRPKLTEGPIAYSLIKLSVPMIFGIISIMIFNLTDAFFIGRYGTKQLAALSFTFPVVMIINSLALGLGIGVSAVISQAIGAGVIDKTRRLTTDALLLGLTVACVIIFTGLLTVKPVFSMLGAPLDLIPLIKEYMTIWYVGVIFVIVPMFGNNAIRATGNTVIPGGIMLAAAVINIGLDPLLIFGLGPFPELGLKGAAIATVFSRFFTFILALYFLQYVKKMLIFSKVKFREVFLSWRKFIFIGLPATAIQIMLPLSTGIVTRIIAGYGAYSVAGYGVALRIEQLSMTVIMAIGAVLTPFAGQNWGAGLFDRVKKIFFYSKLFSVCWGLFIFFILIFTGGRIATLFNKHTEVIKIISLYLLIAPLGYGFQGIFYLSTTLLNVLNKPFYAFGLNFIQIFFILTPLTFLGGKFFQIKGVFTGVLISYFLAAAIGNFFVKKTALR